MSVLRELQEWYESQCNEDWEHQFGISIGTLDNPGWTVTIDLDDTRLADKRFQMIEDLRPGRDWIRCWGREREIQWGRWTPKARGNPHHFPALGRERRRLNSFCNGPPNKRLQRTGISVSLIDSLPLMQLLPGR